MKLIPGEMDEAVMSASMISSRFLSIPTSMVPLTVVEEVSLRTEVPPFISSGIPPPSMASISPVNPNEYWFVRLVLSIERGTPIP